MKMLALAIALLISGPALAEDADNAAQLVKQLDSESFKKREAAAGKLQELGQKAIPALTEAAETGSLETTVRSVGILKNLLESDDKATAEKAKSALEKLAKSDNQGVARRAENAIKPKPQPRPQANRGIQRAIQIRGRVIINNNAKRVQMKNVNGVKTIEAQDGNREVKIVDDPKKGITVEITETKNGKKNTEKFQAKDADQLKKKHPAAYKEYQKYSQGKMGRFQIRRAAVQPAAKPRPAGQRINGTKLDMAGRILQTMQLQLDKLADDQVIKNADNQSRENLQKNIADLKKRLTELDEKLESAGKEDAKENEKK